MYLQTSRLQYNLQGIGVFQIALSNKKYSGFSLYFDYTNLLQKHKQKKLSIITINRVMFACLTKW